MFPVFSSMISGSEFRFALLFLLIVMFLVFSLMIFSVLHNPSSDLRYFFDDCYFSFYVSRVFSYVFF